MPQILWINDEEETIARLINILTLKDIPLDNLPLKNEDMTDRAYSRLCIKYYEKLIAENFTEKELKKIASFPRPDFNSFQNQWTASNKNPYSIMGLSSGAVMGYARKVINGYTCIILPRRTSFYYGSLKYRDLRENQPRMGNAQKSLPATRNLFLAIKKNVSLKYATSDNIHTLESLAPMALFDILDINNITRMLFTDESSPFHYNKRKVKLIDDTGFPCRLGAFNKRNFYDIEKESGFLWLGCMLRYFSLGLNSQFHLHRISIYDTDYLLYDQLNKFLAPLGIDGVYSKPTLEFHSEVTIFSPVKLLKRIHDETMDDYGEDYFREKITLGDIDREAFVRNSNSRFTKILKAQGKCKTPRGLTGDACSNIELDMDNIYKLMKERDLIMSIHHLGATVADHSKWVARTLYKWMGQPNNIWTKDILLELRPVTLAAGFLHDMGKLITLDSSHQLVGYYYLNDIIFPGQITTYGRFTQIQNINKTIISIVVQLHHVFGDMIKCKKALETLDGKWYRDLPIVLTPREREEVPKQATAANCLYYILHYLILKHMIEYDTEYARDVFLNNKANMAQLVYILFAVSAADVNGAYPVHVDEARKESIYDRQLSQLLDPKFLFQPDDPRSTKLEDIPIPIARPYYKYGHKHNTHIRTEYLEFIRKIPDDKAWYANYFRDTKSLPTIQSEGNAEDP